MESLNEKEAILAQKIWDTCDALKASGVEPNNRSVREKLGGGSPNDIAPHVKAWKKNDSERFRASLIEIPEAIKANGDALLRSIWRTASELASKELTKLGAKFEEMEADQQQMDQRHHEETEKLRVAKRMLADQIEQAGHREVDLKEDLGASKAELEKLRNEYQAAILREQDAARYKAQIENEVKSLRQELTAATKKAATAEAKLEINEESIMRLEEEKQKSTVQHANQVKDLQSEAQRLRGDISIAQAGKAAAEAKFTIIDAQAQKLTAELEQVRQQLSEARLRTDLADQLEIMRQDLTLKR